MFFLLRPTATTRFALGHRTTSDIGTGFVSGDAVTGSKLDFQLNDFIPLFVGTVTLRDR